MKRARQHDLFVYELAREMLDAPAMFHRELGLPDSLPLPLLLNPRDEARLRQIVALDDVPPRKAWAAIKRAHSSVVDCIDTLKATMKMAALFDQMSFTREQIEAMPDGYRRAIIAQRRRAKLRIVES